MWNRKRSVALSLTVCGILSAVLAVLIFIAPWLFNLYLTQWRGMSDSETLSTLRIVFSACFYPCAVAAGVALWSLIKLLLNIRQDKIFIAKNVSYLRRLAWCCIAVAAITLTGGVFYLPFLFVAAAAGFMGMILRVLKNVMQAAVELREENDLTI